MGLIFDIDKEKNIGMMVETSGIDDIDKLNFTFNIKVEDVMYGFSCKLKEGKVEIAIPALKRVIKGVKAGKYRASLDVTGGKNYFLQPFNEEVELIQEPKVAVIVDSNDKASIKEVITATVSEIFEIDEKTLVVVESKDSDVINTSDDKKEDDSSVGKKSVMDKMFK